MSVKLTNVIVSSEDPTVDSFLDVQNNSTNDDFFSDENPENALSSWDKYFYYTDYNITGSLSTTNISAGGGTIVVEYTISQNASNENGSTRFVSVTPVVTSSVGTVGVINPTSSSTGKGSCVITIPSTNSSRDINISVSYDGDYWSDVVLQKAKQVSSVSVKSMTVNAGKISTPTVFSAAGETKSISNSSSPSCSITLTVEYDNGEVIDTTAYNEYGSLSGPSYSWSDNKDYCSVSGSYSTASVTMDDRAYEEGDSRTATITRNASYTYTFDSNYGGSSKTVSEPCTCIATQEANEYSIEYGTPVIQSFTYGSNYASAAGGYKTPTVSYYQTRKGIYTSGRESELSNLTSGTISFSGSATGATLDKNTGKVVWDANYTVSDRSITVTLTVSMNGATATDAAVYYQDGDSATDYSDWVYDQTISTTSFSELGGAATLTVTRPSRTIIWASGYETTEYPTSGSFKLNISGTGFTLSDNNNVQFDSITSWPLTIKTISVSENKTLYSRSASVSTELTVSSPSSGETGSSQYDNLSQSAGYYTYGNITIDSFSYGDIGAIGGTSAPSIKYTQKYGWNGSTSGAGTINGNGDDDYTTYSGSGTGLTLNKTTGEAKWATNNPTSGYQDAARSATITATVSRNGKSKSSATKSVQNGEQIVSTGAWTFDISTSSTSIGATGGSSTITLTRPTRVITYDTGDTSIESATSGTFTLSVSNSTFTLSTASINMTSSSLPTFTVSVPGTGAQTASAISTTVSATFSGVTKTTSSITRSKSELLSTDYRFKTFSVSPSSIGANGGTSTLSMVIQRDRTYTGGSTGWTSYTPSSGISVSAGSYASVGSITYGSTSTCTITIDPNESTTSRNISISGSYSNASGSASISQDADSISSYSVSVSANPTSWSTAASGQTTTISYSCYANWVSGDVTNSDATLSTNYGSLSKASVSGSGSATLTSVSNTSTSSSKTYTVTITASNGTKDTVSITQGKDTVKSYNTPSFDMWYSSGAGNSDTPVSAEGGKSASPTYTVSQTALYYSGETRSVTPSVTNISYTIDGGTNVASASVNSTTGVVTFGSLNDNITAATYVRVVLSLKSNGISGSNEGYCWQASNTITTIDIEVEDQDESSVFFIYPGGKRISAAGTSISPTMNVLAYLEFSSGYTDEYSYNYNGSTIYGKKLTFTPKYKESTNVNWASVNENTGVITVDPNASTSTRSVNITCTMTVSWGSLTATKAQSRDCKQNADSIISTTYGSVTAGKITNTTIPASGTTTNYTATAGNGSQTITYSWASGDTTSETVSVSPNYSSIQATASSKGTTVSGTTTVKSQSVTWTGSGSKKATGTMYIYQGANYMTALSIRTWNNSSFTSAGGGSIDATVDVTYTSGSSAEKWDMLTISNWSCSSTGFSISKHPDYSGQCRVTSADRGTTTGNARSCTLKVSYNNSSNTNGVTLSDSKTIGTQEANSDWIIIDNPTISLSYSGISATTTSASPSLSYSFARTRYYTSGDSEDITPITSGATVSYSETTSHSAATVNSRSGVVTWSENKSESSRSVGVTVKVSYSGKEGTKSATSAQNAGYKTYGTPTINTFSYPVASAAGGNVTPSYTYSQTWGWNGSSSNGGTLNSEGEVSFKGTGVNTSTGGFSVGSAGTTISTSNVNVGSSQIIVKMNGKEGSRWTSIYREANFITSIEIRNAGNQTSIDSALKTTFSASGGSRAYTSYLALKSGSYKQGNGIVDSPFYISGTGFSWSDSGDGSTEYYGYAKAASRGTTEGPARTATLTLTYQGPYSNNIKLTDTATLTQSANEATFENPVVSASYDTIPASGGTVSPSVSYSQKATYSSGDSKSITSGGTVTYSGSVKNTGKTFETSTGKVTANSMGLSQWSNGAEVASATIKVSLNNKTGYKTVSVRQAANDVVDIKAVVGSASSVFFTYSGGTSVSAGGATLNPTWNYMAKVKMTSGEWSPSYNAGTLYGKTLSFSVSGFGSNASWASVGAGTGVVTVSSRGSKTGDVRTAQITGSVTAKWGSFTNTLTQSRSVKQNKNSETSSSTSLYSAYLGVTSIICNPSQNLSLSYTIYTTKTYTSGATKNFGYSGATPTVTCTSNGDFSFEPGSTPATNSNGDGTAAIYVFDNYSGSTITHTIKISYGGDSKSFSVVQPSC